jgi:Bacterial PH domain
VSVSEDPATTAVGAVFRLPRTTYLVLLFVVVGVTPVALYGGPDGGSPARMSGLTVLYLIPVLIATFIARTSTRVDTTGIRVSAIFGSRTISWSEIRGLSITKRNIYAVLADGSVRLPCVRQRDLSLIAAMSGGRLPELPAPRIKTAPSRRR